MAQPDKIDLNLASREQLATAGIRPAVADAILQHRDATGPFAGVDALTEVAGIGAATLKQLRNVVMVAARPVEEAPVAVESAEQAPAPALAEVVEAPIEIAPMTAPALEAPVAEAGPAVVVEAVVPPIVAAEAAAAEPAAPVAAASARLPAKPTGYVTGALASLWFGVAAEQLAHGVGAWRALAEAKSWREAMDVQGEYLAASAHRLITGSQGSIKLAGKVVNGLTTLGSRPTRSLA